jgi:hypothetical protein
MSLRSLRVLLPLVGCAFALPLVHCDNPTTAIPGAEAGATLDAGPTPEGDAGPTPDVQLQSDKLDLLLAVDNSGSMSIKAQLLSKSLGPMLRRLANPNCLKSDGSVAAVSSAGTCPDGSSIEFRPVTDIHIGLVTSSLGGFGGDVCQADGENDQGRLVRRFPQGSPTPPSAAPFFTYRATGGAGTVGTIDELIALSSAALLGIGSSGCGLEAQLESMYRFLVQPDPFTAVDTVTDKGVAKLTGIDSELLAQRRAFLRPDSLVGVIMLTDEDDSIADPRAIGGSGWWFNSNKFPDSPVERPEHRFDTPSTTAPRPTSSCAVAPASAECTSCAFAATCDATKPECQKIKNDPNCTQSNGYYGSIEEPMNVRFHRMKQRYGVDPQFPISRYVDGLSKAMVSRRETEHDAAGKYTGAAGCRNPLFAGSLPASGTDELCNLPAGPRNSSMVFFTVIGGATPSLLRDAQGALKRELAPADWVKLVGANPDAYDLGGLDAHMQQSVDPRAGLEVPPADGLAAAKACTAETCGSDSEHGREWDTYDRGAKQKSDLQYACTFELEAPVNCAESRGSCACDGRAFPPVCAGNDGRTQVRGSSYPTPRPLRLAQGLGPRGLVGSICTRNAKDSSKPDYAYTAELNMMLDKMRVALVK